MIRLKQRKGLCPTVEDKNCGQTRFFDTFLDKAKTSETAKTHKKLIATVSRCEGVYNRTDEPSVTFCERGGTV